MGELIERNGLEPASFVSVIFTCTDDLDAQFPAVAARELGLDRVPLLCNREMDVPGAMERVIRVLAHYYAPGRPRARPRLPRRDAEAARRPAFRTIGRVTVTFAQKLAAIPGYTAGRPRRQGAGGDRRLRHRPARLERVALGAAPGGRRGDRARGRAPRTATRTRPRPCCGGGSPSATRPTPAQVAVANGSCEILLAAALALCEPGAEIVYAWPSFSIYPYLAPLSGAREIRVAARRRATSTTSTRCSPRSPRRPSC